VSLFTGVFLAFSHPTSPFRCSPALFASGECDTVDPDGFPANPNSHSKAVFRTPPRPNDKATARGAPAVLARHSGRWRCVHCLVWRIEAGCGSGAGCRKWGLGLRQTEFEAIKTRLGSDGIHLFDRRSGVNVLFDEISVPMEQRSRAPRFVSFALTNVCDLDCAFCYAPKHPASLDFDQVVEWARELDKNGTLGIGFGGGEPTLYPRFSELCATLAAHTGMAISFTTHGHRLTARFRDELIGAVHYIRVSMDGVGPTYERIRHRSFARLVQQLRLVSETCAFGVNYVVNDATVAQLDEAAELVFELGASELLLLPEVSERGGLQQCTRQALLDWVSANCGQLRLAISEAAATDGIPIADPFCTEKGARAFMHVSASGTVSRSSYIRDGAIAINKESGILAAIAEYGGDSK
jgi:hypothetical protein